MEQSSNRKSTKALKINQWLSGWDNITWSPEEHRSKPQNWYYQFSLAATDLLKLSHVYRRSTSGRNRGADDTGIQRTLNKVRSKEISTFIEYGYPMSMLSETKRNSNEFNDLRQPGWLPTSIIVNILTINDDRRSKKVDPDDLIQIHDSNDGTAEIIFPLSDNDWTPKGIPPIEVIDGQHRLLAFEDNSLEGNYELPVVAFVGLDLSWQAYLFYMINIKPKRINASLAFDLYPLLRTEIWLTKFEGPIIYRETRAQELVDLLWSHQLSPWFHKINMLGESNVKSAGQSIRYVSQSSWIRALLTSFIKRWNESGDAIGGLFGSTVGSHKTVLPWSREEQAAFLIFAGMIFRATISTLEEEWMKSIRDANKVFKSDESDEFAFLGRHNLINSDQGNRVFLQVVNDFFFVQADELELHVWENKFLELEPDEIFVAYENFQNSEKISNFMYSLASSLAKYDWRASSSPDLTEPERMRKAAFRGGGGYKELRRDVLFHIKDREEGLSEVASEVIRRLGY